MKTPTHNIESNLFYAHNFAFDKSYARKHREDLFESIADVSRFPSLLAERFSAR